MAFVEKAHTERESGGLSKERVIEPLDLYRITDRFSSKTRKSQENSDLEDSAKRGTSARVDTSNATVYQETSEYIPECPSPVLMRRSVVDTVTGGIRGTHIERKSCNSKLCPVCSGKLKRQYVGHFSRLFSPLPNLTFVTLTIDPKNGIAAEDSRKYIIDRWSVFRKRVHRRGEFLYVAVPESHKSGYTHLHVLCSLPDRATEEFIRSAWFAVGGGVVMDVQPLDTSEHTPEQVVGYVIKYAFKDATEGKGRRSLFCSQGISFHSEKYKQERREYARRMLLESGHVLPSETDMWEPLTTGVSDPYKSVDTPTGEERRYYRKLAKSLQRTTLYVNKGIVHYVNAKGKVEAKALRAGATRQEISKEIRRVRSLQSVP